eukprot:376449-Lingulodinium_polyedra.AAC.1
MGPPQGRASRPDSHWGGRGFADSAGRAVAGVCWRPWAPARRRPRQQSGPPRNQAARRAATDRPDVGTLQAVQ